MSRIKYAQIHIGDFLSGCIEMDATEMGAYFALVMAHYQAGEQGLKNSRSNLARLAHCTERQWDRVKIKVLPKFYIEDGCIKHERVIAEIQKTTKKLPKNYQKDTKKIPNEYGISAQDTENKENHSDITSNQKPVTNKKDTSYPKKAVEMYNATAEKIGIPKMQKLTEARSRNLERRLRDCGGLEGWAAAMEKLEQSEFCRGGNENGWKADFDFVVRESSFVKLMEGKYDGTPRKSSTESKGERLRRAAFEGLSPEARSGHYG